MEDDSVLHNKWTDVEKVILERRSVRLYQKKQVPDFLVKRILEAGRYAPSAGNCQPWKFIVIQDQQIINDLSKDLTHFFKTVKALIDYRSGNLKFVRKFLAKAAIRILPNDLHPVSFGGISNIAEGKLTLYHGAPTVILIFYDSRGVSKPLMDCGIAGQNMILAAQSFGLGTCWVGFVGSILKMKKWKKFFSITYPYCFASSIAIGYPLGNPNGFVERETHQVDWYRDGIKKVVDSEYAGEKDIQERRKIPSYNKMEEISFGHIEVHSECIGCGICVDICPAGSLVLVDKRCRMVEKGECIFCGDCQAICARNAIRLTKPPVYTKYYKTIDRGLIKPPRLT